MEVKSKKIVNIHYNTKEVITDISYDWYGNRIAICSGCDVIIKNRHDQDKWVQTAKFNAQDQ